jgi:nitrite reductase (NADH) large subunit
MESYKYLIVGGGIAGTSAAEKIRTKDDSGMIAIISDEDHLLYSRIMLSKPNFFLGKIPFEQIWMKNQEWYNENKITFLGGQTAESLDAEKKILTLKSGKQVYYQKLLLATGVRPREWNIPGSDKKGIFSLRTLEDGKAIMETIKNAKSAVIVGGGFIGFEMADLSILAGLRTTMILRENYFWQKTLDEDSGKMIENALQKTCVKIIKNAEVTEVVGQEKTEAVILKDGTKIDCDIIICGIGVVPAPLDWLKNAGIKIGNGILADEFLQTNLPDIWTAGDITEYKDLILGENIQLGNWVNASEQGRVAGLNMVGEKTVFKFISFYTTNGAGMNIAFVGDSRVLPDRQIIKRGSPEINSYARILLAGKEIVGATLINRTVEMSTISKLIEKNIDVSTHISELTDVNFDLKKLLVK